MLRFSFKQDLVVLLLIVPPVVYLFRQDIADFFRFSQTSPTYDVEVVLVDESPDYNIQFNPLHPQDFRTFFLGYFFSENIEKVFLHLTDQQQDVRHSWGAGSELIVYSGHSNDFPANGELHIFVHLSREAFDNAGWPLSSVSRHAEGRLYDALTTASSNIEDESKITKELLSRSGQNMFLITYE